MAEEPGSLLLVSLRRLDAKLDRVVEDMREVKGRLGSLEQQYASVSRRTDRLEERLDRIERRLGIVPAAGDGR